MLPDVPQLLICPACRDAHSALRVHPFADSSEGHIKDGVVLCGTCGEWYPIADDILELVPRALLYEDDLRAFSARYSGELKAVTGEDPTMRCDRCGGARANVREQLRQREHFDRYARGPDAGLEDYTRSVFIQVASAHFANKWKQEMTEPGAWVLDVGCGTATGSLVLAKEHILIGFDISKAAVRRGMDDARRRGVKANTTLFVADAHRLPVREQSFRFVHTFGSLHHLPDPGECVRAIVGALKPGGILYSVENNATAFRPLFDILMKLRCLWVEEAGAVPMISLESVREWTEGLPVTIEAETSVFVPPHLFNMLAPRVAHRLLAWSDSAGQSLPWLRDQGGLLTFRLAKSCPDARH